MLENYLNGSVWNRFMQNADIQHGLAQAGFETATGVGGVPAAGARVSLSPARPHPLRATATVSFSLLEEAAVSLVLYDVAGRRVRTLADGVHPAGVHRVAVAGEDLAAGVYWYRLEASGESDAERLVVVK